MLRVFGVKDFDDDGDQLFDVLLGPCKSSLSPAYSFDETVKIASTFNQHYRFPEVTAVIPPSIDMSGGNVVVTGDSLDDLEEVIIDGILVNGPPVYRLRADIEDANVHCECELANDFGRSWLQSVAPPSAFESLGSPVDEEELTIRNENKKKKRKRQAAVNASADADWSVTGDATELVTGRLHFENADIEFHCIKELPTEPYNYQMTVSELSSPRRRKTPTSLPTTPPTAVPSALPSTVPTRAPTTPPSAAPTAVPTLVPTAAMGLNPSLEPASIVPTAGPTITPSTAPSAAPSGSPSFPPSVPPTATPSTAPILLADGDGQSGSGFSLKLELVQPYNFSRTSSNAFSFRAPRRQTPGYHSLRVVYGKNTTAVEPSMLYYAAACAEEGTYLTAAGDCAPCPAHAYCPGGERGWPDPGHWVDNPATFSASSMSRPLKCMPPISCLGGKSSDCAEGYSGQGCAICTAGYSKHRRRCVKCDSRHWPSHEVVEVVVAALFTAIAIFAPPTVLFAAADCCALCQVSCFAGRGLYRP